MSGMRQSLNGKEIPFPIDFLDFRAIPNKDLRVQQTGLPGPPELGSVSPSRDTGTQARNKTNGWMGRGR
jgi:hypothetical protein